MQVEDWANPDVDALLANKAGTARGAIAPTAPGLEQWSAMPDEPQLGFAELLDAVHRCAPGALPAITTEHARRLGATDAALYLVDHEQRHLIPIPDGGPRREAVTIDTTVAGRAFRTFEQQQVTSDGGERLWVPVVDGTERLGVLEVELPDAPTDAIRRHLTTLAGVIAEVIAVKGAYGDIFEQVRRRRPMSLSAELMWQVLPPRTFATATVAITAALAPAYELGGDCFDYAVDDAVARFAVFDAMGHGLQAGLLSTVALAAYRHARRGGLRLEDSVAAIDAAVAAGFPGERFVTGVVAELDLERGVLSWVTAGHPRPLLLRQGKVVKRLDGGAGLPFGLGAGSDACGSEGLEPDDQLVVFTDGVTEARSADGMLFGEERLVDFVIRASSAGAPAAETMRQLMHAIVDYHHGVLRDDATAVLVEWRGNHHDPGG